MKNTLFFRKLGNMSQNLSSAAAVCLILYIPSTIFQLNRTGRPGLNQY